MGCHKNSSKKYSIFMSDTHVCSEGVVLICVVSRVEPHQTTGGKKLLTEKKPWQQKIT